MSFSLYLGPYQPFLEDSLHRAFREFRERDPFSPVTLLVPNFLLVGHLRTVFAERGEDLFNLRISTLRHFTEEFVEEKAVAQEWKTLPEVLVPWVLKETAGKAGDSVFASVRETPGFYPSLRATLGELNEGRFAPELLRKYPKGRLGKKLAEFASALEAYGNWKGKGRWRDLGDLYQTALGEPAPEAGPVWVYGFYDATALQRNLLLHLAGGENCAWFVPYEDHPAFEYAKPFVDWVGEHGSVRSRSDWIRTDGSPLKRLQGNLFDGTGEPETRGIAADSPGDFESSDCKILLCPGEPREAKEIAREVLAEAVRLGSPLGSCGILLRNSGTYGKVLRAAFQAQGIPVSRHVPSPLLESIESKTLLLMLDCFLRDFPRDKVMDFLSCPDLQPSGFKITAEQWNPSRWDVISREARVVEGEDPWRARLSAWREQKNRERSRSEEPWDDREELDSEKALETVLEQLFEMRRRFFAKKDWESRIGLLKEAFQRFVVESDARKETVTVLDSFRLLAKAFASGGPESLFVSGPPEEFRSVLSALLETRNLTVPGERGGAQTVDLMQARGVSFDVVALPGLNERSVPKTAVQDPLLLDSERRELNEWAGSPVTAPGGLNGGDCPRFIPLKGDGAKEERLLFTLAVRGARKALVLTAPTLNPSSGSPQTPSLYLFDCAEAALGRRVSRLGDEVSLVKTVPVGDWSKADLSECADRMEVLLSSLRKAREGQPWAAQAAVKGRDFFFEGCRLLKDRHVLPYFTAFDGMLTDRSRMELEKHALARKPVSASRLETFAACPLRYFYRHLLGLTVHPEPEWVLQIAASDRGNLVHEILEKTLKRGSKEGWTDPPDPAAASRSLEETADRVFADFEQSGVPGAPALWIWEKKQMREDLSRVLTGILRDEEWKPIEYEVSFGEGKEAPFEMPEGGTIRFRGRMDRLDLSRDGARLRVVDYKTGKADGFSKDSVKAGTKLQPPFYLWALKSLYPDKQATEALFDFVTRRGGYRRVSYDGSRREEVEKTLAQVLRAVGGGIDRGMFPAAGKACSHCDYRRLCGTGMEARGRRKQADERTRDYFELEELR